MNSNSQTQSLMKMLNFTSAYIDKQYFGYENKTVTLADFIAPFQQSYWVWSEILLVLFTVFSVYLIARLAQYPFTQYEDNFGSKRAKILYVLCMFGLGFLLLTLASSHIFAFAAWGTDEACSKYAKFTSLCYFFGLEVVHTTLWMQQHFFYTHGSMRIGLLNRCVGAARWMVCIMIVLQIPLELFFIFENYSGWIFIATSTGCMKITNEWNARAVLTSYCLILLGVIVLLFLYPLVSLKIQLKTDKGYYVKYGYDAKLFFSSHMTPEHRFVNFFKFILVFAVACLTGYVIKTKLKVTLFCKNNFIRK